MKIITQEQHQEILLAISMALWNRRVDSVFHTLIVLSDVLDWYTILVNEL